VFVRVLGLSAVGFRLPRSHRFGFIMQFKHATLLISAILTAIPGVACANLGEPFRGGHITGEPVGVLDVAISSETLTIDLRPVAHGNLAEVTAIYFLHNAGTAKTLDLVFASGSPEMTQFRASLGGRRIAGVVATDMPLPPTWQVPKHTPGFSSRGEFSSIVYHPNKATPMAFSVTIPPGRHELKVQYAAQLVRNELGTPTVFQQFAYVLAPARAWAGFGGLEVTVHLPEGWRAACKPELTRDGNCLKGRFAEVPADALTLTIQADEGWLYWPLRYASLALFFLTGLGGILMCWRGGRFAARSLALFSETTIRPLLASISFGFGLVLGIAVLGTGALAILGPDRVLPDGQVSNYGYTQLLMLIGISVLSVLLVPVGALIAVASGVSQLQNGPTQTAEPLSGH
jgi:hypothetical protein